ncbi:MAG TPA: thiamine pyrophosphate-dependent enzyme [Stellaceae bacterium]|nr:thiamine pyrophosphate-dependent enzyme [Stellaceae bacterium]
MPQEPASPASVTCARAVVETLAAHGIDTIFCLPGYQSDWLFNALFDLKGRIRVVHTRHEQGAAYMALGAALATGRPAVCATVPGPGFLNATAALATAYGTNAPVLILPGEIPSRAIGRGLGLLHEIPNQLGILSSLTKWAACATSPNEVAPMLAEAFRHMCSGRQRPVGVEIPPDILAARGDFKAATPLPLGPEPSIDDGLVEQAADLLCGAERPLIFVGGGAQHVGDALKSIAEHIQAPVVSNRMGKGALSDHHPLSISYPEGHRLWKDCDVVLAIGTRLQTPLSQWGTDERLKIIRVDIDPVEASRIRAPALALIGDAATIVQRLESALAGKRRAASRAEEIAALRSRFARDLQSLQPQIAYLEAIRAALPENGIFVDELTQLGYVARLAFPCYRPRTYLSPGYQGTLGWGFAAALGAKVARPDLPVVSISGDGGFMFNVQELATAVHHRIPVVAVVFNDGAYGNVRRAQIEDYGNRVMGCDLTNPDFLRMAESFGVKGVRAQDPDALARAIERALGSNQPTLIEVPCGPMPSPWPFVMLPKVRGN